MAWVPPDSSPSIEPDAVHIRAGRVYAPRLYLMPQFAKVRVTIEATEKKAAQK
jgi:hypothetical protein